MGNGNKSKAVTALIKTKKTDGSQGFGYEWKHNPIFTKHRKNKGQFKRKQNHWSQA